MTFANVSIGLMDVLLGGIALLCFWRLVHERARVRELRARLDLASQRRKVVLDFLHDLGEAFAAGINTTQVLQRVVQFAVNTTQASAGAIFLLNRKSGMLHVENVIGPFPPLKRPENFIEENYAGKPDQLERVLRQQAIALGEGLAGEVAQTGRPVLVRVGAHDSRVPQYAHESLRVQTAMFMPMKFHDEVRGVLVVINKESSGEGLVFNAGDLFLLDSVATHGAISLHNVEVVRQQEEQKIFAADMRVASEIQKMLLPDQAPDVQNFDLHALNHAAQHVSGDYYDFIQLDESRIGVVIADVSGKAVSGALVMATCRALLRMQAVQSASPAQMLAGVYRRLVPDLPEDMFITMTYGILDGEKRTFKFARAGHDPALWYHAAEKKIESLAPKGVAVGLGRVEDFERNLQEQEIVLPPGDILLLYTDGITEAVDAEENEFGRERLIETAQGCAQSSAAEISARVIQRLDAFTDDAPPHDDRTLIVIKSI